MFDFAIIGAGMAGASLAAELARLSRGALRIALLEGEERPGYHTTGRSAAFWEQCYGGPAIVPLTLASGEYLRDGGFLRRRGGLYIAREEDLPAVAAFEARFAGSGAHFTRIERVELERRVPGLRPAWRHAIWQPECADIDVAALHAHYLSQSAAGGVELHTGFRLETVERSGGQWLLTSERGQAVAATTLVNAAGAWSDAVAQLAGVAPLGIAPLRRTVVQLRTEPAPPTDLPLVLDISGRFYFKPEAGRLWASPHDETPSAPCDAAPEEIDVALAIERLEGVVDWQVQAVEHRWAGLRSFAPDRLPVLGRDLAEPSFVWCAGQGGYGIQTAPAAARMLAESLLGLPPSELTADLDASLYAPARLAPHEGNART